MGTRGRRSSASLEVTQDGSIERVARPDAPYDLTDLQTEEWWAIVERLPADWFPRETHSVLAQLCRHVVAARRVAQLIAACEAEDELDLAQYDQLLRMQERETRCMTSVATKLRITQQSTRSDKAHKPSQVRKPWEG